MNNIYIKVRQMNDEFSRAYSFMYKPQCPSWIDWRGGGSLDNGSVN